MFGLSITSFGQSSSPTPSRDTPNQLEVSREINRQGNQRITQIQNPRTNPQFDIDRERDQMILNSRNSASPVRSNGGILPVTLTKEQSKGLLPNLEDSTKYANFLKLPHTGLIKLFPELDCTSKGVIRVDGPCENFVPLSSAYSFRKTKYISNKFADVGLKDNTFFTNKMFSNGIIVLLGDIPIESVSANSNGLKFLSDYQAAKSNKEILAKNKDLANGIQEGGYTYSNLLSVLENTTYAIRVIAYRGEILKQAPFPYKSTFNILKRDKRVDIIAVFRVVRKDSDGTLTLLWKELQRKDSPKIELSREEQEKYLTH